MPSVVFFSYFLLRPTPDRVLFLFLFFLKSASFPKCLPFFKKSYFAGALYLSRTRFLVVVGFLKEVVAGEALSLCDQCKKKCVSSGKYLLFYLRTDVLKFLYSRKCLYWNTKRQKFWLRKNKGWRMNYRSYCLEPVTDVPFFGGVVLKNEIVIISQKPHIRTFCQFCFLIKSGGM